MLEINLILNPFHRGLGLWKFNCILPNKQDYMDIVHEAIKVTKETYAIPVYSYEYIVKADSLELQFTIEQFS